MPVDTSEFFRVKNGLVVGNTDKLVVDGATGDVVAEGNLVINGDLTVNGATTTLNTAQLNVEDNAIKLNANHTGTPTLDAGIQVERGDEPDVEIRWNETTNKWQYTNNGSTYYDFVQQDTDTVYSLTAEDSIPGRKVIRLTGSDITEDDIGIVAGSNLSISRNNNELTLAVNSSPTFTTVTANLTGNVTGNVTGTVSSLSNHTTTNLAEGNNLYYTDARFDSRLTAKTTSDLAEGTNLYYTDTRFDNRLATKSTTNLAEGTNLYYTSTRANTDFDTRLATKSTTDLAEGTNQYFTTQRARDSFTAGTGISISSGQISVDSTIATKTYADSAASTAVANVIASAPSTLDTLNELAAALGNDANFSTTVTNSLAGKLNTSAFTSTADTWLATKSTTNLTEGTNLYYTDSRARNSLSGGTGVTYNASTGQISIGQAVGTSSNVSFADLTLSGNAKITGNKSIGFGDSIYSSSSDFYRDNTGNASHGVFVSNGNMTSTNPIVAVRTFGQSRPSGGTTTAGNPTFVWQSSRGTQASPLAVGSGDTIGLLTAFTNYGDTGGTGSGLQFGNDLYPPFAAAAGFTAGANANHRQTLNATLTGSVSGTTLTVTAVASGTITAGHELRGTGFSTAATGAASPGYVITRQLTSTAANNALGSTGTYELQASPGTIASSTMMTYNMTSATSLRFWALPPNAGGSNLSGQFPAPVPSINAVQNLSFTPNINGGNFSSQATNFIIQQGWNGLPVGTRIIRTITNGNTLDIGSHNLNTTGASFRVTTAGNPNGLTTNTTYFIDSIPSSTTITLRTNSVSGGAVTGLTNGSNLFISADIAAQSHNGGSNPATIVFNGGERRGHNFNNNAVFFDTPRQNDILGRVQFNGNTVSAGTIVAGTLQLAATEDWTAGSTTTNRGVEFQFLTTKTASGGAIYTSTIGAGSSVIRTDSFGVTNTSGTNILSLDNAGNLTINADLRVNGGDIQNSTGNNTITMAGGSNALTTFAGNVRITGNVIQNSTGNNIISMGTGSNGLTTVAGNLEVDGNTILNSSGSSTITMSSDNATTTIVGSNFRVSNASGRITANVDQSGGKTGFNLYKLDATTFSDFAVINFNTVRSSAGTYTPTQNGDIIGQYKFNGNALTGSNFGVPAGPGASITAAATENWSNTANGTSINFNVVKKGTITSFDGVYISSDSSHLAGDIVNIKDSSNNNYLTLNNTKAQFTKPVQLASYTATALTAITGAVGWMAAVSDAGGKLAYWDTTNSRWSYVYDNSAV